MYLTQNYINISNPFLFHICCYDIIMAYLCYVIINGHWEPSPSYHTCGKKSDGNEGLGGSLFSINMARVQSNGGKFSGEVRVKKFLPVSSSLVIFNKLIVGKKLFNPVNHPPVCYDRLAL